MTETKNLLITGPGHAATRLLVRMLAEHPQVVVPRPLLNGVLEYPPLHRFFVEVMDRTPWSSATYAVDKRELFFVLDSYFEAHDDRGGVGIVKMPYYPLFCLDMFEEYFGGRVAFLYCERPVEKIVRSYEQRGEDRLYFRDRPEELPRQLKKLALADRKRHLARPDPRRFFHDLVRRCDQLRLDWNHRHPDNPLIAVPVEELARSRERGRALLGTLGLDARQTEAMYRGVDEGRLMRGASLRNALRYGTLARSIKRWASPRFVARARRWFGD